MRHNGCYISNLIVGDKKRKKLEIVKKTAKNNDLNFLT